MLRFSVTNGHWQQTNLTLSPGRYRLIPEAEGYVSIHGTTTFQVPEAGIIWHYTHLNFEFLHPEDAATRLGVPLCPELPAYGGTFVLPEGTPTPTPLPLPLVPPLPTPPSPKAWPPGTCYAGHFGNGRALPAGLQGQISGLPTGQVATITLYALPPAPDENYLVGCAPPRDRSWTYPPEVTSLAEQPVIAPDWPLTATLTVSNGPWGLVDPSLAGGKYLVMAQSPGQAAEPPACEVVIFGGRMVGMADGVDFAFRPQETPTARRRSSSVLMERSNDETLLVQSARPACFAGRLRPSTVEAGP